MNAPRLSCARARRQRGAVAIVLGLSIFVLFGFLALVIDLGRTYVVRTELQNAADAAALAGARQLNQTAAGVSSATAYAIAIAAEHKFNFGTKVEITSDNISVGKTPDGPWVAVAGITDAEAADKTFLKVQIQSGSLATFFAVVPMVAGGSGISSLTTSGRAVAGWAEVKVTPIGVCAHKDTLGNSLPSDHKVGTGVFEEAAPFGFRQGVSYNVFALGPLGSPSDTYLLNPIDRAPDQPCDPNNSSTDITAPLICTGNSDIIGASNGGSKQYVYGNTGISAGVIEAALNSRFNDYKPPSVCIPSKALPDWNIKIYGCTGGSCASPAADWMSPPPATQTISSPTPPNYGVLWSYSKAVKADGSTEFGVSDWGGLYPGPGGSGGPSAPSYPSPSPYLSNVETPSGNTEPNRRVLNLVIADCGPGKISGPAACQKIEVLAIGAFFMQVPADFKGSPKKLEVEFAGLVPRVPPTEIQLFR